MRVCSWGIAAAWLAWLSTSQPARAELFRTYWRLVPEQSISHLTVAFDAPVLRQRLVPVAAVVLDEAVTVKAGRSYEKGTPLYLLLSKDGRPAFCAIKDRSLRNQAKTLFMPLLDERPCFRDRDGDGRFDAVFFVSDALTGPPAQGGDMDAVTAIPATVFTEVNPSDYPEAMTVFFQFLEGAAIDRIRIRVMFENAGSRIDWQQVRGTTTNGDYAIEALNSRVTIRSLDQAGAVVDIRGNGVDCIRRVRGGLLSEPCPTRQSGLQRFALP